MIRFKEERMADQFNQSPSALQKLALDFTDISAQLGKQAVVTRVCDHIAGSSGVHEVHRAVDFRDEYDCPDGTRNRIYDEDDVNYLVTTINEMHPRQDGKLTCIHHSFNGGPMHFHLQIPASAIDS